MTLEEYNKSIAEAPAPGAAPAKFNRAGYWAVAILAIAFIVLLIIKSKK
jgi:hypothetical protein